jgi:hypoxanthine phosphoribosyltransferase
MSFITSWKVREIMLAELESVTRQLVDTAWEAGFRPDCVVYLETGARLLALQVCRHASIRGVALRIQRRGGGGKGRLARLLGLLPTAAKDLLRQMEARMIWRNMKDERVIGEVPSVNLSGCRVLILDDAVDTGTSVRMARQWALNQGASEVRVGALTVTTSVGVSAVDFTVFREMCRFPWSSDSRERVEYQQIFDATYVPRFTESECR